MKRQEVKEKALQKKRQKENKKDFEKAEAEMALRKQKAKKALERQEKALEKAGR